MRYLNAVLVLPFMVTVVVPVFLLLTNRPMWIGWPLPFPARIVLVLAGVLLAGLGLALVFQTVAMFAMIGEGTLAPWDPPKRLVVKGVYQRVRNPMISGVFGILLGEALVLGSPAVAGWCAVFITVNLIYIPLLEEPGLEQRFGADYIRYKQNVPRWLPRRTPWKGMEQA